MLLLYFILPLCSLIIAGGCVVMCIDGDGGVSLYDHSINNMSIYIL